MAIPFVVYDLDRPRKLRLGMQAMVFYEMTTGKKIREIDDEDNMETVGRILHSAMYEDDKTLTFDETLRLIDDYSNFEEAKEMVVKVVSAAIGKQSPNVKTPKAK